MLALTDFSAKLNAGRQELHVLQRVYVDVGAAKLAICLCVAEDEVDYHHHLLLWVEQCACDGIFSLKSQDCNKSPGQPSLSCCEAQAYAVQIKLPYARTSLVDIHLGREGDFYYVHLLVIDGDQPADACPPLPVRFQLSNHGCFQLGEGSHSPPVLPVEQFLNPPSLKPKLLTTDFNSGAVLPWPLSLGLLMLASALVGWICAVAGQSREGPGATMATLMLLLGTVPFFARRVGGYTLTGLLIVATAGVLVSLAGFLFKANVVVFPFLFMGALLGRVFCTNAYGKAKAGLIDLEKKQPHRTKFLATRTEQEQNMLWIGDFAIVLVIVVLLVWGYSRIQSWFN